MVEKLVELAAEAINVGHKIVKGGSVFGAVALVDELSALQGLDGKALLLELKNASEEDRKKWDAQFKAKLVLSDADLEKKLEAGADLLVEGAQLIVEAVDLAKQVKALIEKAKLLGGVA